MSFVVGRNETVGIDLGKRDLYGKSGFRCTVMYVDGSETLLSDADMNELIKDVPDVSTTANGDTVSGSTKIPVADASGFNVGDVVNVDGKDIYFYVNEVDTDNNVLTARNPIDGDITDGDTIRLVGNTGVYSTTVTPTKPGKVYIVINNPSIGLYNKAKVVEVLEHNEDDIYSKMLEKFDEIEKALGAVDGEIIA